VHVLDELAHTAERLSPGCEPASGLPGCRREVAGSSLDELAVRNRGVLSRAIGIQASTQSTTNCELMR